MFFSRATALEQALGRYAKSGIDWSKAVGDAASEGVRTPKEAEALAKVIHAIADDPQRFPGATSAVLLLQEPNGQAVSAILAEKAVPALAKLIAVHGGMECPPMDNLPVSAAKIAMMYQDKAAVAAVIGMIKRGQQPDDWMWSVVFSIAADAPGLREAIAGVLSQPLPQGFCCVAFLDFCNTLCREHGLKVHPFDGLAGFERLGNWISDTDPEHASLAVSAAAALPFLGDSVDRSALLNQALAHQETDVRLEAAWAAARLGRSDGFDVLAAACLNPASASKAASYLEELGAGDRIPAAASSPEALACAEMARWLSHPQEFGHPPDEVTVIDRRDLHWPPTDDDRSMSLVRYRYLAKDDQEADVGVGCVGSVTFALFGIVGIERKSPEDLYGMYCTWELQARGDARVTEISAPIGRRLLAAANPGFAAG
ncbi:hypothetical protein LBMAG53_33420 [Planctomycetota bacterium]|nr:hypothetical protein LBMAG53_33420 [Planctomycetota bacterium]